jgi:transcriptional regulator with XRE-family HTH domain
MMESAGAADRPVPADQSRDHKRLELAAIIRVQRRRRQWTWTVLAARCGLCRQSLHRIATGRSRPRELTEARIRRVLDLPEPMEWQSGHDSA